MVSGVADVLVHFGVYELVATVAFLAPDVPFLCPVPDSCAYGMRRPLAPTSYSDGSVACLCAQNVQSVRFDVQSVRFDVQSVRFDVQSVWVGLTAQSGDQNV